MHVSHRRSSSFSSDSFSSSRSAVSSSTSSHFQEESIPTSSTIQSSLVHRERIALKGEISEVEAVEQWLQDPDLSSEEQAEACDMLSRVYNKHGSYQNAKIVSLEGLNLDSSVYMKNRLYQTLKCAQEGQSTEDQDSDLLPTESSQQSTSYEKIRL